MGPFTGWPQASAGVPQQPGVHVWGATVAGLLPRLPALRNWLSGDERERAAAFHFESHRAAYIAAHGVLHDVVARYVGIDRAGITFATDGAGRPSLAERAAGVDFNLSHAGDAVLVAVAAGQSVGVDVEEISSAPDTMALAERFFAREEIDEIRSSPEGRAAFFGCWTKKEAVVKAIGRGLSIPLDSFVVGAFAPRQRVRVADDGALTVVDLDLAAGYAGAVAMQWDSEVTRWAWAPVDVEAGR